MNPHHAAALALLRWYLMYTPATNEGRDPNAPLSRWLIGTFFDTAAICEKARAEELQAAKELGIGYEPREKRGNDDHRLQAQTGLRMLVLLLREWDVDSPRVLRAAPAPAEEERRMGGISLGNVFERIFEPEIILPSQQKRAELPYAGERWLALATIIQAVRELQGKNPGLAAKASMWFRDETGVLTFELACHWLGLDPEWLRPKILTGTLRRLPRHGSPFPPVSREWESSPGPVYDTLDDGEPASYHLDNENGS